MPFNFYTRIKSDLSITIIVIQHSIFVYLFIFTKKFHTFLCCHVIWCLFISIWNTPFIFLVRWVSLGLSKHIYESYFGFSVHINLITTSLGSVSRDLIFLLCLEHLCLFFSFSLTLCWCLRIWQCSPLTQFSWTDLMQERTPNNYPSEIFWMPLSVLFLPRKKQAAVIFISLLGAASGWGGEQS